MRRLSVKAYARHRRELGLPGATPAAVRKALERGQIKRLPDGSIDAAAADRAWPADPAAAPPARGEPAGGTGGEPEGNREAEPPVSFGEARRRKELALARQREYHVANLQRTMIHIDDVEAMVRRPLEQVDASLRSAPARHAAELAREAGIDLTRAKRILEGIIEGVRTDLRDLRAPGAPPPAAS